MTSLTGYKQIFRIRPHYDLKVMFTALYWVMNFFEKLNFIHEGLWLEFTTRRFEPKYHINNQFSHFDIEQHF